MAHSNSWLVERLDWFLNHSEEQRRWLDSAPSGTTFWLPEVRNTLAAVDHKVDSAYKRGRSEATIEMCVLYSKVMNN